MITEKQTSLKPILESCDGVHLSAYIVNRKDLSDLKLQLRDILFEAEEYLVEVFDSEERKNFLEPLYGLMNDARILKNMKGNIGLFRNQNSFRVLNIPVDLVRQCHVATSFHVKPLLRWMQVDRDFLILGLTKESAHLYQASQNSVKKLDSVLFPQIYLESKNLKSEPAAKEKIFVWLNEWVLQTTLKSKARLYLAGEKNLIRQLNQFLKYRPVAKTPILSHFDEGSLAEVCSNIRLLCREEAKRTLERSLVEFRYAEELNLAKKNIFQIAKAAVQGRVKKLIVADGVNIFGKIDKKTGSLALHPFDLDHEDDDILDDLAQTVLAAGGQVIVAAKDEIPKNHPILAILEPRASDLEKNCEYAQFIELQQKEAST